ncbi:hypothetical protein TRIUR3_22909 [Triticum urartu]|uniref:Uncharacterized protein n=1 Tax=Triticum urartu TaxID=4572 RepID=M8B3Y4_TRIUA|nr:hypothetical protein TRIUR3_22909 [Triticum urartu]
MEISGAHGRGNWRSPTLGGGGDWRSAALSGGGDWRSATLGGGELIRRWYCKSLLLGPHAEENDQDERRYSIPGCIGCFRFCGERFTITRELKPTLPKQTLYLGLSPVATGAHASAALSHAPARRPRSLDASAGRPRRSGSTSAASRGPVARPPKASARLGPCATELPAAD